MLYVLSGAEYTEFQKFGIPRPTEVFAPTFAGGPPIRLDDVTADPRYGHNAPHHGMPQGHLAVRSYLAVSVVAHDGVVLGGLFFGHPEPGVFDERAERNVVGLAGYAATAVQNARLFDRERLAAITLQRSLLPMSLPEIPGARLASAYEPASHHTEIGGDWYDALAMPDGSYSLTVGDVGGHDLRAAGVMGQLRTVFRMSSIESEGPIDVLTKVDRYHSTFGVAEFATAIQATYDPCTSTLRIASAGHPAPLLIEPDGAVRFLDVDTLPGVGSGLVDETDDIPAETVLALSRGTQVLFFTDGLIERRDRSVDEGLDRLATAAADFVAAHPEGRNEALLADLLRLPSDKADDVALLLLSIDP
jgi:serine phosphatase RsbU (regulator of sigma subunit)